MQVLIAQHFPNAIDEEIVRAFCDIYLFDASTEQTSGTFLYPHDTLRDFGLALGFSKIELPPFAWIASEFEHFVGYWVGLQTSPNAAAVTLIAHPYLQENPLIITDIIAANQQLLEDGTRRALWQLLGKCLAGRRIIRDAAASAVQGLTREMRVEAIAFGMLEAAENRWPNITQTATIRILSELFRS